MDTPETMGEALSEPSTAGSPEAAEAAYQAFVWKHLPRNFAGHFMHGMLGMTGFRLFNGPTFLPAYIHLITGSDLMVGLAQSLQQVGGVVSPVVGGAVVEHRRRVLPISVLMGSAMRLQILGVALAGFFLTGQALILATLGCLLVLGFFQGAQGVAFQLLLAKVIPTRLRGRLQALRNMFGGAVAAGLSYLAGRYLIQRDVLGNGFSSTFLAAFVLASLGLAALAILMREPRPPIVREKQRLRERVREFPAMLSADRGYMYFMIAQTLATGGRIAVPFYILFARHVMPLTGNNLGLVAMVFQGASPVTAMVWGMTGDRLGFRAAFIAAMTVWIAATMTLLLAPSTPIILLAFLGLGAAQAGFMMSSQTMVLEFGAREDVPMRLALSQTAQGTMNAIGPLIGGAIAMLAGYTPLFILSMVFEGAALILLIFVVDEPRFRIRDA
ncbi:MAG: MFS transporter [Caulobacteraceae bacterium]